MVSREARSTSGRKLIVGFDDNETKEFNQALKQGLLVQTPLQVLLETLFCRLQTHAQLFSDLQRRVEKLESRELDEREILHRVQLCEGRLNEITSSKLSPFNQQGILSRLEELENNKEKQKDQSDVEDEEDGTLLDGLTVFPLKKGKAKFEDRLAACESKLSGVYNLTGKLMAMEHIADELGVEVPDLEYTPGMSTQDLVGQTRLMSPARPAVRIMSQGTLSPFVPSSHRPRSQESDSAGPVVAPTTPYGTSRTAELRAQIVDITASNEALKETVDALGKELREAQAELSERQGHIVVRVEDLEACTQQLKGQMVDDIAAVKTLIRRDGEVSFADFSLLQSQVQLAVKDVHTACKTVSELKEHEIKTLNESIVELQDSRQRSDAPREVDTLFHQRLSAVEAKYTEIRNEVQTAASNLMQDMATASDLDGLAREVESKASQLDVRQLAMQQQSLAQSVNGMAEWLAVRPETADGLKGTGASATKFKCLTCDRDMRSQSGSNGSPVLKGSFLPKLDHMTPATSSQPTGPGLTSRTGRQTSPGRTKGWACLTVQEGMTTMPDELGNSPSNIGNVDARAGSQAPPGATSKQAASRTPVFF